MDDTLLGDDQALWELVGVIRQSPQLWVVLNSSRPIESIQATLAGLAEPLTPQGLIGAMGTRIMFGGRDLPAWQGRLAGWDRSVVDRVMADLGYPPHDPAMQTRYKASFAVPRGADQERARRALGQTGMDMQMICSGTSDFDVLPPAAGKGRAAAFLAADLGIDRQRLIVAGDSANDLAMFDITPKGIVVGNARKELREAVDPARAYLARAHYASGILEGLLHWGAPLVRKEVI